MISIDSGNYYNCALKIEGPLEMMLALLGGNSDSSQLGNGTDDFTDILLPAYEVEGATDIYASLYYACVRMPMSHWPAGQ